MSTTTAEAAAKSGEPASHIPDNRGMTAEVFSRAAGEFFTALESNNRRDWFDLHRGEWRTLVKAPLDDLLAHAESQYGSGRVMRINRDVRFSADKSPYNTAVSLWAGGVGGVYLRVSADGLEVGGGLYEPSRDQLARARHEIDGRPAAADDLERILAELTDGGFEVAGPSLATAPRGYPKDHPRIDLLRLKHYAALKHLALTAPLRDIEAGWAAVEPLIDWVTRRVGPAEQRP